VTVEPIVDDEKFAVTQRLIRLTALRGEPLDGDSCSTCLYYLEPGEAMAYCWHEKLQTLVGKDWWCHYWEPTV
jgi:hypothetical protein